MNVYDFDKTIYKKDSSLEFYKYVLKKNPALIVRVFPIQLLSLIKYLAKKISKEQLKENFFCFLKYIDVNLFIKRFVNDELKHINGWYIDQKTSTDVWISASPYFLVHAFATRLGIERVLATNIDIQTGHICGKNCHDYEKVFRFQNEYPNDKIDKFYSDSKSDMPMAMIAKQAFQVKKEYPQPWSFK